MKFEDVDTWNLELPLPSESARREARDRQDQLTKPRGSLGRLEELAIDLAGWMDDPLPKARPAAALLFAADHGASRLGISAYPREVTRAMVLNFLAGGAAVCTLARLHEVPLRVFDVGVDGGPVTHDDPTYVRHPVANAPSGDLVQEDAMSERALTDAIEVGRAAVANLPADTRVVMLGEMGIGNTFVASALTASLLGGDPGAWVGPGTGLEGHKLEQKRDLVRAAVRRVEAEPRPREGAALAADRLRRLGGREIAAMVGAMVEAARRRRAVLVDGFIVTAAALAATRLAPRVRPALVFAHHSAEPAHGRLLDALGARPLLDLGLRLGEGSGALVAFPLLEAACEAHGRMATFSSAKVPDRCA